jgi:DNA-binding response OmpR family regulator
VSEQKQRLLIIDDDPNILGLVNAALRSEFEVEEATTAAVAREILGRSRFDLVLCDWMLPDTSGDRLLAWAKQEPALSSIPFVMVTARDDREYVVTAIRLGADGYLVKPFTTQRLRAKVRSLVGRKSQPEEPCRANLHYRNQLVSAPVIELRNQTTLVVAISRNKFPPHIFEEVKLQLERGDRRHPGLTGQVLVLRAPGLDADADHIEVHIDLSHLDEKMLESLRSLSCRRTAESDGNQESGRGRA